MNKTVKFIEETAKNKDVKRVRLLKNRGIAYHVTLTTNKNKLEVVKD